MNRIALANNKIDDVFDEFSRRMRDEYGERPNPVDGRFNEITFSVHAIAEDKSEEEEEIVYFTIYIDFSDNTIDFHLDSSDYLDYADVIKAIRKVVNSVNQEDINKDLFHNYHATANAVLEEQENILERFKDYINYVIGDKYDIEQHMDILTGYLKGKDKEAFSCYFEETQLHVQFLDIHEDDDIFFGDYNVEYLLMGQFDKVHWNGKEPKDI